MILLSSAAHAECQDPINGRHYTEDKRFCSSTFYLPDGISVEHDNIVIDCNHAVLKGTDFKNAGITVKNRRNVIIKNCKIANYAEGISICNSTGMFVYSSTLMRNKIGMRLQLAENNTFEKNMDISTERPVRVIESKNNKISFTNKNIEEDFCRYNACNTKDGVKQADMIAAGRESLMALLKTAIQGWITSN